MLASLAAAFAVAGSAPRTTVVVLADPALREFGAEIERKFESAKPNLDLRITFVGGEGLARRLSHDGTPDVLLAPLDRKRIVSQLDPPRIFARTMLSIVASSDEDGVASLADLATGPDVLGALPQDPSHAAVLALLDRASRAYGRGWLGLVEARLKPTAIDVRGVLGAVAAGKSRLGFVYETDTRVVKGVRIVPIPAGLNSLVSFAAYPRSARSPGARAFVDFLFTGTAQSVLVRRGFRSPLAPPAELPVFFNGETLNLFVSRLQMMPQSKLNGLLGADLVAILRNAKGTRVRFTGADGRSVDVRLAELRANGAVLVPAANGDVDVTFGGRSSTGLRWVRRIDVL